MLPHRLRADDGFSLVELLVAMLILGVLVAAALPSLLSQRTKAQDTNAQTAVATAAKAATAFGIDRGRYDDLAPAELVKVERSLQSAHGLTAEGAGRTFTVSVESAAGTTFSITRAPDGVLTRDCAPSGTKSCDAGADAHGNRW